MTALSSSLQDLSQYSSQSKRCLISSSGFLVFLSFSKDSGTVLNPPTTTAIILTLVFHSIFSSLARSNNLSVFLFCFFFCFYLFYFILFYFIYLFIYFLSPYGLLGRQNPLDDMFFFSFSSTICLVYCSIIIIIIIIIIDRFYLFIYLQWGKK